jgi:hypothetical protein
MVGKVFTGWIFWQKAGASAFIFDLRSYPPKDVATNSKSAITNPPGPKHIFFNQSDRLHSL